MNAPAQGFADLDAVIDRAAMRWRPPPRLHLSDWADKNFVLSSESAAVPGPWRTLPYQRGILDAITDDSVEQVSVMKSSRVGYTLCISAAIGFYIHQDPSSMLVVQPTVDDAKGFSKETIAPMLRDVPVLSDILYRDDEERGPKDASATLRHKTFPGGVLSLIGANSGAGFRRVTRRVAIFDEVDAYPASAGSEGDPVSLGVKRTESFHNRKIIAGSTPLIAGASRIEEMFLAGDQRRYHVPCPHCGHMDILSFRGDAERGHVMKWPEGKPDLAAFWCRECGCEIEHKHKRWMVERGEWRADKPGGRHRSFHLWAALSYSPNATWGHIAREFVEARRGGPEKLKTFVNTTLGETWQERGEAPDWEKIYQRREMYPIGSVPRGARFLTAGVDVQKDRFVYEVVGWAEDKSSWSVDAGELMGDTSDEATWNQLDELMMRTFPSLHSDAAGATAPSLAIAKLAIDSGYNTQQVYGWARRYPMSRVIACKGMRAARALIGISMPVDVTVRGKRMQRGYKAWIIGVDIAKSELYGWLRLPRPPEGEALPPGWCHFPEHSEEFFRQLTAEHLVTTRKRNGYTVLEWQLLPNRENHFLDCRVYARAAASVLGLDRLSRSTVPPVAPLPASPSAPAAPPPPATLESARPTSSAPGRAPGGWLGGRRGPPPPGGAGRPGGWLGKRR